MFFIPLILVMWVDSDEWFTIPVPVKPYYNLEKCESDLATVKLSIMKHPKYRQGIASCVEFTVGDKT
tara:strand:+ start:119 stop:319 length:201 start_codon:yes stop_codon:yes gene_type:complete